MPVSESHIPDTISSKSFDELREEFFDFLCPSQPVDEESLRLVASSIVAREDFRHFYLAIFPEQNLAILRWIDEDGAFDSEFTLEEIEYLIFGDLTDIQPGLWYTLSELCVFSSDYINFDVEFCNGEAAKIVDQLLDEARKFLCICSVEESRVDMVEYPNMYN